MDRCIDGLSICGDVCLMASSQYDSMVPRERGREVVELEAKGQEPLGCLAGMASCRKLMVFAVHQ